MHGDAEPVEYPQVYSRGQITFHIVWGEFVVVGIVRKGNCTN